MRRKSLSNLRLHKGDRKGSVVAALDVGTTNVKAFVFGEDERVLARASLPLSKSFPRAGWVEQDPMHILHTAERALSEAIEKSGAAAEHIAGLGITNQRETIILWDRTTGTPLYPAIVWEDVRTEALCQKLRAEHERAVQSATGLPIDPYFSASKVRWLLNEVPDARARATREELCVGTVDSWLLWNVAEGHPHKTDETNASRTLLYNITTKRWDDELLALFDIPRAILPEVRPSAFHFGSTVAGRWGAPPLPICAVVGDQQASLYAAGHAKGTTKVTFGTGIFLMQIVGETPLMQKPFFTTLAAGKQGQTLYALEKKINECAARVTPRIGHPQELNALLDTFAGEVATGVAELPIRPRELVIDGGVTQAPHLRKALEGATGIPAREHALPDGTALGVARLVRDALVAGCAGDGVVIR